MNHETLTDLQSLQAATPAPVSRRTLLVLAAVGWVVAGVLLGLLVIAIGGTQ
jgi:hypothetical protein